ncbi:hypothetical protein K461DRAFT_275030 [Myriangium duriaei CBS 260.36]|uniref:Uncharacterized protein n=1 Tax=Myriangium duriaei CBS 260.36 TaxID=1168546 RepID=A0A9P4MIH1_9PEZI|nr:hypothetical protein K461DRAFT_275030 [Myriangium duriaei CBS 260.36]
MTSLATAWIVQAIKRSPVPILGRHVQFNRVVTAYTPTRNFWATIPREKKRPVSAVLSPSGKYQQNSKKQDHSKPAQKNASATAQHPNPKSGNAVQDVEPAQPLPQTLTAARTSPLLKEITENTNKPSQSMQEPSSPLMQTNQPRPASIPYERVDYIKSLSHIAQPVCIYQAPPQRRYAVVCYGSMLFFVAVAKFNYNSIIAFAGTNPWALVYAGIICTMYGALAMYCGMAPQKMVRSIYAVPTQHGGPRAGPMLEVTFKPILPFQKAKPLQIPAIDMTRDAVVAATVEERVIAESNEKLRFRWGKAFFRMIRGVLFDVVNMFTRKNFVYISLPRAGQCKVDLPGTVNLGRGHALEQLVHMDQSKRRIFRKMFS